MFDSAVTRPVDPPFLDVSILLALESWLARVGAPATERRALKKVSARRGGEDICWDASTGSEFGSERACQRGSSLND